MYLPDVHLQLAHARLEEAAQRQPLRDHLAVQRPRPPSRPRRALAHALRRAADRLAHEHPQVRRA